MIFEIKDELIANGVDPHMIHFELFTTTDLKIEEDYSDRFSSLDKNTSVLAIKSGTIELNDNKIIILVD